jgi:hypothetical protein
LKTSILRLADVALVSLCLTKVIGSNHFQGYRSVAAALGIPALASLHTETSPADGQRVYFFTQTVFQPQRINETVNTRLADVHG